MKLGFKLRNLKIKLERIIRQCLFYLDYSIWFILFRRDRNYEEAKNILIVDLSKAWGDVLITLTIANKVILKNPEINFHLLLWDKFTEEAKKGYDFNFINFEDVGMEQNKEFFDMAIICWMSDKKLKDLPVKYKVGIETGGIHDTFKNWRLQQRIAPEYIHKIKQRFNIFELAEFEFEDKFLGLPYSEYYSKEADKIMEELNLKETDKIFFINPEAGTSNRAREEGKYPSHDWDKFPQLIEQLLKNPEIKIIILGTKEILNYKHDRVYSLVGKTSFFGLGELMRKFKDNGCIIGLDTATSHLGSFIGIKSVNLMGSYDPKLIGTWQGANIAVDSPCSNCRKYYCPEENNICMKNIKVEDVMKWIEKN